MGVLKDLFKSILDELAENGQGYFGASAAPIAQEVKKGSVRKSISDHFSAAERMLLMSPEQRDAMFLFDESRPFDEVEFIAKSGVSARLYMRDVKECICELDDLSEGKDKKETEELHSDELSQTVLNALHKQAAQIMILNGKDEKDEIGWFVKQPKEFMQATLIENDRKADAFADVRFKKDLTKIDVDCNEYLLKSASDKSRNAIRKSDENFNRDAMRLVNDLQKAEYNLPASRGKERDKIEKLRQKTEQVLEKATEARETALKGAFRDGKITEYYYHQRTQQLESRDYTRVPEMFEVDELKDKERYLKDHDLQDLSPSERDSICVMAQKRGEKDKETYLKKDFLAKKGLASSERYLISEMAIDRFVFNLGLAAASGRASSIGEEERISVDLDDELFFDDEVVSVEPNEPEREKEAEEEKEPLKRSMASV